MRNCAYCIEALNSLVHNEKQASEVMKQQLNDVCLQLNSNATSILREHAINLETMKKSSKSKILIQEMNCSLQEVKIHLESLPGLVLANSSEKDETNPAEFATTINTTIPLVEIIPLVTFASLLIEIPARIEAIAEAVEKLANMANFKTEPDDGDHHDQKQKHIQTTNR